MCVVMSATTGMTEVSRLMRSEAEVGNRTDLYTINSP